MKHFTTMSNKTDQKIDGSSDFGWKLVISTLHYLQRSAYHHISQPALLNEQHILSPLCLPFQLVKKSTDLQDIGGYNYVNI